MAFNFLKNLDADDIFISYSREDGSAYLTGLDAALSARGFSCFTDKRGTDADPLPPKTLFQKIRACKTLVLLGTPGALVNPQNITPELKEFAEANGTARIVCVSFDRDAKFADWPADWQPYVVGKAREREDPAALKTGEPSAQVIEPIVVASDYMKSKDRLLKYRNRALWVLALLVLVILAAAVLAGFMFKRADAATRKADEETAKAEQATRGADKALAQARAAQDEARAAKAEAETAQAEATQQRGIADLATKDAEAKTKLADAATRKAQTAQAQAKTAQAEAKLQQAIADSRSLANRSQTLLHRHPDELLRSVSLAADALNKYGTGEADAALREGIALLPRLSRSEMYAGDITDAALSPGGRYFATLAADDMLRVYESGSQTPLKEIPCRGTRVALSGDAAYAAVASKEGIRIYDLKNDRSHAFSLGSHLFYKKLALSPGGRHLAVLYSDFDPALNLATFFNKVWLLDAASGQLIKSLTDDLVMGVNDIAFGPTGDLALGGYVIDGFVFSAGRAVIWPLSDKLRFGFGFGKTERELAGDDFSHPIDISLDDSILAIAPGADYTLFATDRAVWRRMADGKYEAISRIPVVPSKEGDNDYYRPNKDYRVERAALNLGGTSLIVIRSVTTTSNTDQRAHRPLPAGAKDEHLPTLTREGYYESNDKLLEVWNATEHREAASAYLRSFTPFVWNVAFEPGGQLVAAYSGKSDVRLFRSSDGSELRQGGETPGATPEPIINLLSRDLNFVVTAGEEAAHVRDVWTSKTSPAPYAAGLKHPSAGAVSTGGHFLALVSSGVKVGGAEEEDGESEDGKGTDVMVAVYRRVGDAYAEWKRLRLEDKPRLMALTPDGRLLVTLGLDDSVARLWNVADGRDVTFEGLRKLDKVASLSLSPEGRFLAVHDVSSQQAPPSFIRVWRLADGKEVVALSREQPRGIYLFSPGGRYLLEADSDRLTRVVDLSTGRVRRVFAEMQVETAAFSLDELYLGVGDDTGLLRVYRTDDLENEVARLQHDRPVEAFAFSDDDRLVATVSRRSIPRKTAEQRGDAPSFPFLPTLDDVLATEQNQLRIWLLRPKDLLKEASSRRKALPAYAR